MSLEIEQEFEEKKKLVREATFSNRPSPLFLNTPWVVMKSQRSESNMPAHNGVHGPLSFNDGATFTAFYTGNSLYTSSFSAPVLAPPVIHSTHTVLADYGIGAGGQQLFGVTVHSASGGIPTGPVHLLINHAGKQRGRILRQASLGEEEVR